MKKKIIAIFSLTLMSFGGVYAQDEVDDTSDSNYNESHANLSIEEVSDEDVEEELADTSRPDVGAFQARAESFMKSKPIPLPAISDPLNTEFYKTVYREVIITDSSNQLLSTLMDALWQGLADKKYFAYLIDAPAEKKGNYPWGDGFTTPLTLEQAQAVLVDSVDDGYLDETGDYIITGKKAGEFSLADVDKVKNFIVKEEIYYDKQRSRIITNVIAIAPVLPQQDNGQIPVPSIWFNYSRVRKSLVTREVSNPLLNFRGTLDDVFLQHVYNGKITRVVGGSNRLSEALSDEESEREEEGIREFKRKVWKN